MTQKQKVVLTRWARKERLGHGKQTEIAKRLKLADASLVSKVIHCEKTHVRNPRVEKAIAEAIGLPEDQVFPAGSAASRWLGNGDETYTDRGTLARVATESELPRHTPAGREQR